MKLRHRKRFPLRMSGQQALEHAAETSHGFRVLWQGQLVECDTAREARQLIGAETGWPDEIKRAFEVADAGRAVRRILEESGLPRQVKLEIIAELVRDCEDEMGTPEYERFRP